MVVVPKFYEARKKNFAGGSRANVVRTDPVVKSVHSAPQPIVQVQPLVGLDSREGMLSHSGSMARVESQLGEGGELTHETRGLLAVQVPTSTPLPPIVQGEFLESQIYEIDRALS